MQLLEGSVTFSASDLTSFVTSASDLAAAPSARGSCDVADGGPQRRQRRTVSARKGLEHERRYLASLIAQGRNVVEIPTRQGVAGTALSAAETLAALRAGADIVYQGVVAEDGWLGHVDFLRRVERGAFAPGRGQLAPL